VQGEPTGQYWDLDEAGWVSVDGDASRPADEVADEFAALDAVLAPSEPR
jgi:hypothetical protein